MKTLPACLFFLLSAMLVLPAWAAREDGSSAKEARKLMLSLMERSNGVYSLHEAAEAGNEEVMAARLKENENPNRVDEEGNSPLHIAVKGKSAKIVRILLQGGADPNQQDAEGRTVRQACTNKKFFKILDKALALRNKEAEVDALVRNGDVAGVRKAIKGGVSPNARSADSKGTLLLSAVETGKTEVVRALLALGAKVDAVRMDSGDSALHIAAKRGHAEIIRMLLKAGADPMKPAGNGSMALHDAVWHHRLEAVKALLPAYACVNFSPNAGHHGIPINTAISRNATEIVRAFIGAGINLNDKCFAKAPPLVIAASKGHTECARLLLEGGADKNARDAAGKTAADYANPAMQALLH